jgi:hypothetical protein
MSDSVKLTPALPVVPPLPLPQAVRPDLRVEPAAKSEAGDRPADNGNGRNGEPPPGPASRNLSISRQEQLGTFIYRAIDKESGDVVWQYPPETVLRSSQHLLEIQKMQQRAIGGNADEKA